MGLRAGLEYPEGDPGGLLNAASRVSTLGAVVSVDAASVSGHKRVDRWKANGAEHFAALASQSAADLTRGTSALAAASSAVERLGDDLARVQKQIERWAKEIEEAERAVEGWETAMNGLWSIKDDKVRDHALEYHRVRRDAAQQRLWDLRDRYEPKARQLCNEVRDADRAVALAVAAAAGAAPQGGSAVPGAPHVPADVRLFSPTFLFAPGERYLPADPRRNASDLERYGLERFLRGAGAGAPVFYRVRRDGDETVYEYWFYRRYNDFRNLGRYGYPSIQKLGGPHFDDAEGYAVRFKNGRPVRRGHTQHEEGCSVPFGDDDPLRRRSSHRVYPGLGSAANSPYRGSDDSVPGPFDDLHGGAPGERTPRENIQRAEDNLQQWERSGVRRRQLLDPDGNRLPNSEPNRGKFDFDSDVWNRDCDELPPRE